jgi:hypothetical protein
MNYKRRNLKKKNLVMYLELFSSYKKNHVFYFIFPNLFEFDIHEKQPKLKINIKIFIKKKKDFFT